MLKWFDWPAFRRGFWKGLTLQALWSRPMTRSQKMQAAGFTRRKTWRSLPSDE